MENPKLAGSRIIDCIPQTGECPNHYTECYYNGGRFYRPLDQPLLPTRAEACAKIVRVNSGNDSNNQRELVIEKTGMYQDKFYNTAIPRFDFPGPVVLTINPQWNSKLTLLGMAPDNLMFVRVRAHTQDVLTVRQALEHYSSLCVPVVVTFMRYYSKETFESALGASADDYVWKRHITNEYWVAKPEAIVRFMAGFVGTGLRMCGTPYSSFCVDCGHCEEFYYRTMDRLKRIGEG